MNLMELIKMKNVQLGSLKIHLAQAPRKYPQPLDEFLNGTFKEWQEAQSRQIFKCNHIISLIQTTKDEE